MMYMHACANPPRLIHSIYHPTHKPNRLLCGLVMAPIDKMVESRLLLANNAHASGSTSELMDPLMDAADAEAARAGDAKDGAGAGAGGSGDGGGRGRR